MKTCIVYIQKKKLVNELSKLDSKEIVAGRLTTLNGFTFPQGSFRVFSQDIVKQIILNKNIYPYWLPEDVATGKLLLKIRHTKVELANIDIPNVEVLNSIDSWTLKNTSHFRCKGSIGTKNKDRQDAKIMMKLHEKLENLLK